MLKAPSEWMSEFMHSQLDVLSNLFEVADFDEDQKLLLSQLFIEMFEMCERENHHLTVMTLFLGMMIPQGQEQTGWMIGMTVADGKLYDAIAVETQADTRTIKSIAGFSREALERVRFPLIN